MMPVKKINRLPGVFGDLFYDQWPELYAKRGTAPQINVIETDKKFKIQIAAPGMTKDDFKVHVNKDGNLVIEMEKKKDSEEKKEGKYIRREFAYTRFHQTLILPENAEKDKIEAKVENGVLKVCIPKLQNEIAEPEKRVIEVK